MRRTWRVVAAVAALTAPMVACGDDDGAEGVPSTIDPAATTTLAKGSLPPPDASDLEPIYGDALAELGLELTDRGGLIDRSGGGYYPSDTGTHLALYVEPIDDRTAPQYIEGIRSVAVVFSDVFDRWPGLATYDVCQEPVGAEATPGDEPLPVTQIELTKAQSDAIDWDTVTVVELVGGSLAEPPRLALRVSSSLAEDPAYQAIVDEAT